jgi:osmotically-inducible protein OsmY
VLTGVRGVTNTITLVSPVRTADVQKKIEDAFRRSAEVDARRVEVHATDGRIVLRGNVRSWAERAEAQQAAWSAPGVINVENNLIVMP